MYLPYFLQAFLSLRLGCLHVEVDWLYRENGYVSIIFCFKFLFFLGLQNIGYEGISEVRL
jgi:hypothetical protein